MWPTRALAVNGYIFLAIWSRVTSLFLCFFNHVESDNRQDITFDPYCIIVGLQPKNILKGSEKPRGFIIAEDQSPGLCLKHVLGLKLQNAVCENITWKWQYSIFFHTRNCAGIEQKTLSLISNLFILDYNNINWRTKSLCFSLQLVRFSFLFFFLLKVSWIIMLR